MSAFIPAWILACCMVSGTSAAVPAQESESAEAPVRKGQDVHNVVEGRTTIIFLKPQGARVEKGELVCELESFSIRERLNGQERTAKEAENAFQVARRAREAAESAVTEYVEGKSKQELQKSQGEVTLAEMTLKGAEVRLGRSKQLLERGLMSRGRYTADELAVQRARLALEQAQRKRETLEKFTRDKTIKILQSKVEKARSEELAKQADYGREQAAREHLLGQIEKCKVTAPGAGRIGYSSPIEEGAEVDKGQLLFLLIPDETPKTKAEAKRAPDRDLRTNRR
jgi:multidrug resistance efflux pump